MSETERDPALPPLPPATDQPRIFLAVVDESAEMNLALYYACLRARRTGGRVALLQVIEPGEFQHWMSVGNLMRDEARQEAEKRLQRWIAFRFAHNLVTLDAALCGQLISRSFRDDVHPDRTDP